jgi:hypothetical protein
MAEGMMLQVDGSPHDWLQGRGSRLCLIGAIDDAGEKVPGAFFAQAESSCGCFARSSNVMACRSRSIAIGTRSSGPTTLDEQLINKRPLTQLGRALDELGVT